MDKIVNAIGVPAMYEQLAEECVELAKESLKMARILRGENPTPVTKSAAEIAINEEFNDVALVAGMLGLVPDSEFMKQKLKRWDARLGI